MSTWSNEFGPEYRVPGKVLAALKAAGFEDESWHNDACPKFEKEVAWQNKQDFRGRTIVQKLTMWCEPKEKNMREGGGGSEVRFCVTSLLGNMDGDYDHGTYEVVYNCEKTKDLIAWLQGFATGWKAGTS